MGRFYRATLTLALVVPLSACAGHRSTHIAPDESVPHITWEIRTGGDLGDADLVCGSPQPAQGCVVTVSTERERTLVTVRVYLHAAARQTSYLGVVQVPFMQGGVKGADVSATVPVGSQPVGSSVIGEVTSKPGEYAFTVLLDTKQAGMTDSQRIEQQAPVVVR